MTILKITSFVLAIGWLFSSLEWEPAIVIVGLLGSLLPIYEKNKITAKIIWKIIGIIIILLLLAIFTVSLMYPRQFDIFLNQEEIFVTVPTPRQINNRFTDNGNGTISDSKSGLMWKRCTEGLNGYYCTNDKAKFYSWYTLNSELKNIKFAEHEDWRIPTIQELSTLVYCSNGTAIKEALYSACGEYDEKYQIPTIDLDAFPNTHLEKYWSISIVESKEFQSDAIWADAIDFEQGAGLDCGGYTYESFSRCLVRLVRDDKSTTIPQN